MAGRENRQCKGPEVGLCVGCTGMPWKPLWVEQNEQEEGKDVLVGERGPT